MVGTRPEIIRLSRIIPKLDKACSHILVHTQQSYDDNMSGVFFRELNIRKPDYMLENHAGSLGNQLGKAMSQLEHLIDDEKPDRLLILGDTNSALSAAIISKRLGIKVYHMEAGNRCFSDVVPEEINRRVIDSCSDILMPYTERARQNLISDHYPSNHIYVTGNPIYEVINNLPYQNTLIRMGLPVKKYFLATAHRQENVDNPERLNGILDGFAKIVNVFKKPLIFSCHPRTLKRIKENNLEYVDYYKDKIFIHEPFGIVDFTTLERNALCVISDSGTTCEDCSILHVPCVTIRDVTERPETIECGSNILSGVNPDDILRCVNTVLSQSIDWTPPVEYTMPNVSDKVVRIITGY